MATVAPPVKRTITPPPAMTAEERAALSKRIQRSGRELVLYLFLMSIVPFVALGFGKPVLAFFLGMFPAILASFLFTRGAAMVPAFFTFPVLYLWLGEKWPPARWLTLSVPAALFLPALLPSGYRLK